jgi:hypothetical protein
MCVMLLLWMLMLMLMLWMVVVVMIVKGVRWSDLMLCVMLYVGIVADLVGNDYAS